MENNQLFGDRKFVRLFLKQFYMAMTYPYDSIILINTCT